MRKIRSESLKKQAQSRKTLPEVVSFYLPDLQEMVSNPELYSKEEAINLVEELLQGLEWLPE